MTFGSASYGFVSFTVYQRFPAHLLASRCWKFNVSKRPFALPRRLLPFGNHRSEVNVPGLPLRPLTPLANRARCALSSHPFLVCSSLKTRCSAQAIDVSKPSFNLRSPPGCVALRDRSALLNSCLENLPYNLPDLSSLPFFILLLYRMLPDHRSEPATFCLALLFLENLLEPRPS